MCCKIIFAFLLLSGLCSVAVSQSASIYLTIAYCPTLESGAGAVVSVDPSSGEFAIVNKFHWPSAIIGCPADGDEPTVAVDGETLYMYFIDESFLLILNLTSGELIGNIHSKDLFFTGFENMVYIPSSNILAGVSPDVTQKGFCNDGCFAYGNFSAQSGAYQKLGDLPFKAALDDSHYWDTATSTFYIQASYDLRPPSEWCAPVNSDECLLAIDMNDGSLLSAKWTNWTAYKYGPVSNGNVLAWVEGFPELCHHPFNDFLFASITLQNASAVPIACISKNVTVDMDEWIASFSPDGSMLATGSGDTYTGVPQLLVFNTATGEAMLNSALAGLGEALGAKDNLFLIWSVDWL